MNVLKLFKFLIFLFFALPVLSQSIPDINQIKKELQVAAQDIPSNENIPAESYENTLIDLNEPEYYKEYFGYSFFTNSKTPRESFTDIPMDGDYKLSYGDEVSIVINGVEDYVYNLNIDLIGNVLIPSIGSVKIGGLNISDANKAVANIIKNKQIGSESFLSLNKASLRKISIVGEVTEPGSYLVNPFSLLTEVISYAGFLKKNASIRTVTIINKSDERTVVDLYDFLINGAIQKNVTIENGDTILIRSSNQFVSIDGAVKEKKLFEYVQSDSYGKLIEFAKLDGFADKSKITSNVYKDNILVTEKINYSDKLNNSVQLNSIYIPTRLNINSTNAQIIGSAVSDGFYQYSKGDTLTKILNQISFSENIYPFAFHLEQFGDRGFTKVQKVFSVFTPDAYESFELGSNVKISFLSRDQITKINEDSQQEEFKFNSINSLYVTYGNEEYILPMAGIFSITSIMNYLGIQDQVDLSKTFLNSGEKIIKYNQIAQNDFYSFAPGMHLSFTPKFYGTYIDIELEGEINFPGKYRVKKGTSYLDIIELAGGYAENVDLRGVFLSRNELREKEKLSFSNARDLLLDALIQDVNYSSSNQINSSSNIELLEYLEEVAIDSFSGRLVGDFREDSVFKDNLSLQDGDKIIFAQKVNYVTTQGQLNNPSTVPFEHSFTLKDYIDASGGLSKYADKKSIYVIKYNGESVVMNSNLFQQDYIIQPGDIIIVPRNIEFVSTIPLVSQTVRILSDIAFTAASLNAIRN